MELRINNPATHSGDTIHVCPGSYGEQLALNKSVTLRGVAVPGANGGAGAAQAIIAVPSDGFNNNGTVFSTTPLPLRCC